jgi:predicted alpha/beta superfamily hydrolase
MRNILTILLLSASFCKGQNVINNNINIGLADSLHSSILNETQRFWISLPTSFYNPKIAKARYPVIYVFDGDANFATVSALQKQLSIRSGSTVMPEAIVVGVMNNSRDRDFTPYPSSFWVYDTPTPLQNTGGGERFVRYLQKELMPHIDSLYPTAPYRVLIGHSLGGLAATNILVNHTQLFNSYIIIDPSMWYDNHGFLDKAQKAMVGKKFNNISVYLAMAHSMGPGISLSTVMKDHTKETLHPRGILRLKKLLESKGESGLRFKFNYYVDNTHMNVPPIAEYDGFRFIFNFYDIPPALESAFLIPENHIDPARYLVAHYKTVSANMGYEVLPSENLVLVIAHTAADYFMPQKALGLFELNVKNYPQSYGSWYYLGEFYEGQKEKDKAISCYKKAFSLNGLPDVQAKLKNLELK